MRIRNTTQETTREERLERQVRNMLPVVAPEEQLADVKALADRLAGARRRTQGRHGAYKLVDSSGDETPVPEVAIFMLELAAEVWAQGDAISTVPVNRELRTQQAANILLVSRQYLVRLLDEGRIPCTRTGKHRRVRVEDVLAFKEKRDRERSEGLDELVRMTEEFGGYENQG